MEAVIFLLFLYLLAANFSLKDRITTLEQKVDRQMGSSPSPQPVSFVPEAEGVSPYPETVTEAPAVSLEQQTQTAYQPVTPIPTPPAAAISDQPAGEFFLYAWFKEQTLIKIGSIIFFLGAVWFVSYAIEQNWISPVLRIMLGLLLAGAVYVVGWWRSGSEQMQYQVLTVLGTSIFLGTVVASQFAFAAPVLPAALAFTLMVISIGYTLLVAVKTRTEWLAILAAVAGICVPYLVKDDPTPVVLLSYLFVLTASFLAVVFFTHWRSVSLTLLSGSALVLSSLYQAPTLSETTLWFFVVLFSALFCASTTVSVLRSKQPLLHDVISLCIITLQFIIYAMEIALLPALALFIAATVTGFIGYSLRVRGAGADSVSLYVMVSLILLLVGTAELFDGFVLTIAYALEALALFLLSLRFATVSRSVYVAAALFTLPICSGLVDLGSDVWRTGIVHPEALGTLTVIVTLGVAIVWIISSAALQAIEWLRHIAGALLVVWYGFVAMVVVVVAGALEPGMEAVVTITTLLFLVAVALLLYISHSVARPTWQALGLLSLIIPTSTAIGLLTLSIWSTGIGHQPFWTALLYMVGLVLITIYYWVHAIRTNQTESMLGSSAYALTWVSLGYSMLFFSRVWDAIVPGNAETVVQAITFIVLTYLTVNCLMLIKASASRVTAPLLLLVIPGLMLVESLALSGWSDGVFGIDAVGLYVSATILFLLGTTLRHYRSVVNETERELVHTAAVVIFALAGGLSFLLVWMISHTIMTGALAVTIALLVYTVAGLLAYSYGRSHNSTTWRRVGVLLLSTVVLRLVLVDVWVMELVWRIVTFLVVGLLFIITALFEKSADKHDNQIHFQPGEHN